MTVTSITKKYCTKILIYSGLLTTIIALSAFAGPVAYELRNFPGIPVHVVTVDMSSPYVVVEPQIAAGGTGSVETFRSMIRRTRPVAAITGAFFDTRSKYPVGDITIRGEVVHKGFVGAGICIDDKGKIEMVSRKKGMACDWQGYQTVLCGGPTLLREGKIVLSPKDEGFKDPGLFRKAHRTAAGVTANNKLLMVSINRDISLKRLALIMQSLGAKNAITLDGGSSTGLWFNGKLLSEPRRSLTNVMAVHIIKKPEQVASRPTQ